MFTKNELYVIERLADENAALAHRNVRLIVETECEAQKILMLNTAGIKLLSENILEHFETIEVLKSIRRKCEAERIPQERREAD